MNEISSINSRIAATSRNQTIPGRPSLIPSPGVSPRRQEIAGTLSLEPPLHVAAGTLELDEDTVVCSCDWGCEDCDPAPTRVWRRP